MKVLVIDDDPDVAQVISLCFEMRWPQTATVSAVDGTEGLSLIEVESPDVVILDVGLPEMNGFEVCREIRQFSDVPIIMLTVRDADTDISRALELGADDYISKPFSHIELLSRVQAVLRRTQRLPLAKGEGVFSSGQLRIDFDSREVTYQTLLSKVWSEEYEYETNLLKLHIHNLRHKLGDNPQNPGMIVNERGVGYKLVVSE